MASHRRVRRHNSHGWAWTHSVQTAAAPHRAIHAQPSKITKGATAPERPLHQRRPPAPTAEPLTERIDRPPRDQDSPNKTHSNRLRTKQPISKRQEFGSQSHSLSLTLRAHLCGTPLPPKVVSASRTRAAPLCNPPPPTPISREGGREKFPQLGKPRQESSEQNLSQNGHEVCAQTCPHPFGQNEKTYN